MSADDGASERVLTTKNKDVFHTRRCKYAARARTLRESFTREVAEDWGREHCRECARLEQEEHGAGNQVGAGEAGR